MRDKKIKKPCSSRRIALLLYAGVETMYARYAFQKFRSWRAQEPHSWLLRRGVKHETASCASYDITSERRAWRRSRAFGVKDKMSETRGNDGVLIVLLTRWSPGNAEIEIKRPSYRAIRLSFSRHAWQTGTARCNVTFPYRITIFRRPCIIYNIFLYSFQYNL